MKGITNEKESNKNKSDLNAQREQKSGVRIATARTHKHTSLERDPSLAGARTLSAPFAMAKKTMPTINAAANGKLENKSAQIIITTTNNSKSSAKM